MLIRPSQKYPRRQNVLITSSPKIPDGTKCVNTLILYTATFEIFIFAKFEQELSLRERSFRKWTWH